MRTILALMPRLITLATGLLVGAAGAGVAGIVWRTLPPPGLTWRGQSFGLQPEGVAPWTLLAALAMVLGLAMVIFALAPTRSGSRSRRLTLPDNSGTEGLSVHVTAGTLASLVTFEAAKIRGVRAIEPVVALTDDGWSVDCDVTMWRDRAMRDLAEELDERLRETLLQHTGVHVAELDLDLGYGAESRHKGRVQ